MHRLSLTFAIVLLSTPLTAAEPVKSGLQVGEKVTSIFEPVNINGEFAGQPHCLVCENGTNPVAMVFAREPSAAVLKLATKLDAATVKHEKDSLGSFVVFLSDGDGLDERLTAAAKKHKLAKTILAIDPPAGPEGFNVAADAEVTVVLYREFKVLGNHAFRKGELNEPAIERIVADLSKIVPAK
jgi:hypothetical protein